MDNTISYAEGKQQVYQSDRPRIYYGKCRFYFIIRFIMYCWIFLVIAQAYGQKKIAGKVIHSITKAPLSGVRITPEGTGEATTTDVYGTYTLEIPDTVHLLTFSFVGMKTLRVNTAGMTLINVALEPNTLEAKFSEKEVVSAAGITQKIIEAPAIISIITAQEIEERGYRSIAEAVNSLPGVDNITDHAMHNLGLRGINGGARAASRIVKVMIDNQPVSFRPGTENFLGLEMIPILAVDRIEVVRGPTSALYGANAFLGIINIITKKSSDFAGGLLSFSGSNPQGNLSYEQQFIIGNRIGQVDFVMAGSQAYIDRSGLSVQDIPGENRYNGRQSRNDAYRPYSIFGKFSTENSKLGAIDVDFNVQHLQTSAQFVDWGILEEGNTINLQNSYIRAKYIRPVVPSLTSYISAAYAFGSPNKNEALHTNTRVADFITRDLGYKGLDLATAFTYHINKKSNVNFGTDYTNDLHTRQTYYRHNGDETTATGTPLSDAAFDNLGVELQAILYPFPSSRSSFRRSLGFTLGMRYDRHNVYEDVINYRVAGVFQFLDKMYVKLLYGTSFRAPASTQLYSTLLVPGDLIGNPDLVPERAQTFEIALGGEPVEKLNIQVNSFYNKVKDKVEITSIGPNLRAENSAEINTFGLEAEAFYSNGLLSSYLNFSYQFSVIEKQDIYSDNNFWRNTKLYPEYLLKGGGTYRVAGSGITLHLEGRYVGRRIASLANTRAFDPIFFDTEDESTYKLDDYFLLDFTASTTRLRLIGKKDTRLEAKFYNLLDMKYYYPGFRDHDIQGLARFIEIKLTQYF